MISKERAEEIADYVERRGKSSACYFYDISQDTLSRYLRLAKEYNGEGHKKPKIFIFDIETSHIIGATFNVWQTNIRHEQILRDWHMISWAGKWLDDDEVFGDVLYPDEAEKGIDYRITKSLRDAIDEADIVVAHNGDKFDIKKFNTRCIINGIKQPRPYKTVDTLKAIKRKFAFTHNGLDPVNNNLGLGRKLDNAGNELWLACIKGDEDSLHNMFEYNKGDVLILEELYLEILGWIPNHPNVSVFYDSNELVCRKCGSTHVVPSGKDVTTSIGVYEGYVCEKCGAYSKSRKNKKMSLLSVASGLF